MKIQLFPSFEKAVAKTGKLCEIVEKVFKK